MGPGLWRVRSAGQVYAVRFLRRSALHGLDPGVAAAAFRAAGEAGLGPRVRHVDDVDRPSTLVLEFLEGTMPSGKFLQSEPGLNLAARLLEGVPPLALPAGPLLPDRSLRATLGRYQAAFEGTPWAGRAAAWQPLVLQALADEQAGTVTGFVHGDVHAGNLIQDGTRLWLIDWEYAGRADPLLDLASLAVNAVPDAWRRLFALHGEGQASRAAPARAGLPLSRPAGPAHEPTPDQVRRSAGLMLGAGLRDLFWGYAQDLSGAALPCSDYVRINERRVETLGIWLTDPGFAASTPAIG